MEKMILSLFSLTLVSVSHSFELNPGETLSLTPLNPVEVTCQKDLAPECQVVVQKNDLNDPHSGNHFQIQVLRADAREVVYTSTNYSNSWDDADILGKASNLVKQLRVAGTCR